MFAQNPLIIKPNKILVIALRYLGDVLLTTPLIRSLRLAYPEAIIAVLVYEATAGMLAGNPDLDEIITQPAKQGVIAYWRLVWKLLRQYDLAISTQVGDRPMLYAMFASACRIGPVPVKPATGWWKGLFLKQSLTFDDEHTHTVLQHLKLLDLLQLSKHYSLVPPSTAASKPLMSKKYVVLHVYPQWTYKRWTDDGWLEIAAYCHQLGFQLVLSGGPGTEERAFVATLAQRMPTGTLNLAGQLSLAELADILAKASLYIGPDTGITHLAAATACPVIAIFGPTNPVVWAPWPNAYQGPENPFLKVGSQRVNNVFLLQGEGACVPCHLEGCDRHQQSRSRCLDEIQPARVIAAIQHMLKP